MILLLLLLLLIIEFSKLLLGSEVHDPLLLTSYLDRSGGKEKTKRPRVSWLISMSKCYNLDWPP